MKRRVGTLFVVTLSICALASLAHGAAYEVTKIAYIPKTGLVQLDSFGISNSGQVFYTIFGHDGYMGYEAWVWDKEHGLQDASGFDYQFQANSMDSNGDIVGTRKDCVYLTGAPTAVVRDGQTGQFRDLPVPSGATSTEAYSVNNMGETVGAVGTADSYRPVLWLPDGTYRLLGTASSFNPEYESINDCGAAIFNGWSYASRWDEERRVVQLPSLLPYDSTRALAINDAGQILGISGDSYVVWNRDDTITDLSSRISEDIDAAWDIGNHGQIVGQLNGRAVMWNPDGSVVDLGVGGSIAVRINDAGQILGLSGDEAGTYVTLWTPVPEPSTLLALICGLAGVGMLLRRRR